jgi:hypothetical protein
MKTSVAPYRGPSPSPSLSTSLSLPLPLPMESSEFTAAPSSESSDTEPLESASDTLSRLNREKLLCGEPW